MPKPRPGARRYSRWTLADQRHLRTHYPEVPAKRLAAELGKPVSSTAMMLTKLGLRRSKPWTQDEERRLRTLCGSHSIQELTELLGHPYGSVRAKLRTLGCTIAPNWTQPEDRYLLANYGPMSAREIGKRLGRSTQAVRRRARRLGLQRLHLWTPAEEERLRELYASDLTVAQIAKAMEMRDTQIYAKARAMNLAKRPALSPEAEALLWQLRHEPGIVKFYADHFGVSERTIERTIERLERDGGPTRMTAAPVP
jgi:transposase